MRRKRDMFFGLLVAAGVASLGYGCAVIAGLKDREELVGGTTSSGGGSTSGGGMGGDGGGTTSTTSTMTGGGDGGSGGSGAAGGGGGMGGSGGAPPTYEEILALQQTPQAIGADDTGIFWTTIGPNETDKGIWKWDQPGGSSTQLATALPSAGGGGAGGGPLAQKTPLAIAADSVHVYWSEFEIIACTPGRDRFLRIARDGSMPLDMGESLHGVCGETSSIVLDQLTMYWARTDSHFIQKRAKAGMTNVTVLGDSTSLPSGLAVDGLSIYWPDQATSKIFYTPIAGGAIAELATSPETPVAIGVDTDTVYWTTTTKVMKLPINSPGGMPQELYDGLLPGSKLAVDPAPTGQLYVLDTGHGDVIAVQKDGSGSVPIFESNNTLGGIAVNSTHVYWTNSTQMKILRFPLP